MNTYGALLRQAWFSLALWLAFGLFLEGFIGFRIPALLDDPLRREMLRLAHAHGTLLNLVLIAAAICARLDLITLGRWNALALRLAVLSIPLGFFLGGIWHFRDDPGLGIVLVPIGALFLLASVFQIALTLRTSSDKSKRV